MSNNEQAPPASLACRTCGAPSSLRPPARPTAGGGWEAEYECENGHRQQLFTKPKQPRA